MTRTRTLTAAALVALLGITVGVAGMSRASAAALTVDTAPAITASTALRCAAAMSSQLPATPVLRVDPATPTSPSTSAAVTVAQVPAACTGLPLTIRLHNAAGAVIGMGHTDAAHATQDVPVGTYAPADVRAAVASLGGWIFPTSWAGQAPVTPGCVGVDNAGIPTGQPCTLTLVKVSTWYTGGHYYTEVNFNAVTAAPRWLVTLDFSDASLWTGFMPVAVTNTQNVALAPGYSCDSLPVFQGIEANPQWGSANAELVFTTNPAPAGDVLCGQA